MSPYVLIWKAQRESAALSVKVSILHRKIKGQGQGILNPNIRLLHADT